MELKLFCFDIFKKTPKNALVPVHKAYVDDRVWSVAANDVGLLTVGTAGTRGGFLLGE